MIGRERLATLVEAKNVQDVMARLSEYGVAPAGDDRDRQTDALANGDSESRRREDMLLGLLRDAYNEVDAMAPDPEAFRWFRYPYDVNNVKVALKCFIRGIESDGLLFDFGTVAADRVMACVREQRYDAFPPHMAQAAVTAYETYSKTMDPQQIDAILDKACYADMLAAVKRLGDPMVIGWLKAKIDLCNFMICLRLLRMKRGDLGRMFLGTACLEGGTEAVSTFVTLYEQGEEALWDAFATSEYSRFVREAQKTDLSLAAIERCADNEWMERVKEAKWTPFGAPVLGGYLIGTEMAVKNIRIVLAAKEANLTADVIRERVRDSYV
jgi:V/A-type H+-transporting ATPase subunit C